LDFCWELKNRASIEARFYLDSHSGGRRRNENELASSISTLIEINKELDVCDKALSVSYQ
jgi:hypothetical protein